MGSRRLARENCLQMLYQHDLVGGEPASIQEHFWGDDEVDAQIRDFATQLFEGTVAERERIDELITAASINWKLPRMSYVDRNILRLAVFEFLGMDEIPAMVSLNEAIELGKRFGSTESGSFINGILDRVARTLQLPGVGRRRQG